MREQREPWLTLPAKEAGGGGIPRLDPRFRTHVVEVRSSPGAAQPLPRPPGLPVPEPAEPATAVPLRSTGGPPTPDAIERAAAAAWLSTPASTRPAPRSARPGVPLVTPRSAPKSSDTLAPGAPEIRFDDLPTVTSADWVLKVGEAAKIVDVVVVFYTAAYLGSDMFELAFRTVVNQVLPQFGRPYTVYRFSLDAEPGFVPEMAESLGLASDNPVTVAGFAWSGPGRPLFLIGDHALESPAAFQRSLRRNLAEQQPDAPRGSSARYQAITRLDGPLGQGMRPWSGRVLAVLAWCLFGTAALGAAVVGVAPQWASSLLHPESVSAPKDPPRSTDTRVAPAAASPGNATGGAAGNAAQGAQAPGNSAKPAQTPVVRKKKPASTLSASPTYWGLPEGQPR